MLAPHGNLNRTSLFLVASHHEKRRAFAFGAPFISRDAAFSRRDVMRRTANCLVTTSLVLAGALVVGPLHAADLDTASQVDAVTVYPDGASVTRVITLDLPAGDNTLIAKDFPMGLDPSSLRVEGDAGAKLTIGAIDARPPHLVPPVNLPDIDIAVLDDGFACLQARCCFQLNLYQRPARSENLKQEANGGQDRQHGNQPNQRRPAA